MLPAFGQMNAQVLPTEKGTLDVDFSTAPADPKPGDIVKLQIDFINPNTEKIQEHIDYRLTVSKDGLNTFGPIPLTHTSTGSVSIPVEFGEEGMYSAAIEVEGILFQPIPRETVLFQVAVGEVSNGSTMGKPENGGCLIATAAFGSELSPQVQQLRELRDNVVLNTESGKSFMTSFNQLYYSFSPTIADYERQNPFFKEFVKMTITPMLSTLSILNFVDINSEQEMLGYGISIILLNVVMYFGIPIVAILKVYQFRKK